MRGTAFKWAGRCVLLMVSRGEFGMKQVSYTSR